MVMEFYVLQISCHLSSL